VKLLLKISIIALILVIAAWIAFSVSRVSKNQSVEIVREFAKQKEFMQDNLQDLPLLRFEATNSKSDYFIFLLPGDGGWRDFIDYLSNYMSGSGINVVGFNTIPYFNHKRTPKEIALDIQRVITNFSAAWGKKKVILAGYSFGAEILPFVYINLERISATGLFASQ
jgi:type IV secretory pathway VirJ component